MHLILFDIDGTLTNTKVVDDICFSRAMQDTFNISCGPETWEGLQNITDWGLTEELVSLKWGRIPNEKEYDAMTDSFLSHLQEEKRRDHNQFAEIPGANKFLQQLSEQGDHAIGIATGGWEKTARFKLESAGIEAGHIHLAHSNHEKSRERIMQFAKQQAEKINSTSFERIIYFGDGLWDMKASHNLNFQFIGIDVHTNNKLKVNGAKDVFEDYLKSEEILSVIFDNSSF